MSGKSELKNDNITDRIVFIFGLLLLVSEVWKQIYSYVVVNQGHYDVWIFPFQLCSMPIYFCIILPFITNEKWKRVGYTFLIDFNLLGGIMAFFDTSGFQNPYRPLVIHSYLWHISIIGLGIFLIYMKAGENSWYTFETSVAILLALCVVATILNGVLHRYGSVNLFYISFYEASRQPVFREIAAACGIVISNLCYIAAMILGGGLIHGAVQRISQ